MCPVRRSVPRIDLTLAGQRGVTESNRNRAGQGVFPHPVKAGHLAAFKPRNRPDYPRGRAAAPHPTVFEQCDEGLHNRITGETWNPDADPLKAAALLVQGVQEELCLLELREGTSYLVAWTVCFSPGWRPIGARPPLRHALFAGHQMARSGRKRNGGFRVGCEGEADLHLVSAVGRPEQRGARRSPLRQGRGHHRTVRHDQATDHRTLVLSAPQIHC